MFKVKDLRGAAVLRYCSGGSCARARACACAVAVGGRRDGSWMSGKWASMKMVLFCFFKGRPGIQVDEGITMPCHESSGKAPGKNWGHMPVLLPSQLPLQSQQSATGAPVQHYLPLTPLFIYMIMQGVPSILCMTSLGASVYYKCIVIVYGIKMSSEYQT